VGGVGLIEDYARRADFSSMQEGDALLLIGEDFGMADGELGSSMYLREVLGREDGAPPPVDLAVERRNGDFVRSLIKSGQITVCHDVSDGGLIACVAEMALASGVGIALGNPHKSLAPFLFGEHQARYVIAVSDPTPVLAAARTAGVPAAPLGGTGGDNLVMQGFFDIPLDKLRTAHEGWMPGFMGD
jgi:phosphoribosylformylglycinamidine synthase